MRWESNGIKDREGTVKTERERRYVHRQIKRKDEFHFSLFRVFIFQRRRAARRRDGYLKFNVTVLFARAEGATASAPTKWFEILNFYRLPHYSTLFVFRCVALLYAPLSAVTNLLAAVVLLA
jgi:hypothetical protein